MLKSRLRAVASGSGSRRCTGRRRRACRGNDDDQSGHGRQGPHRPVDGQETIPSATSVRMRVVARRGGLRAERGGNEAEYQRSDAITTCGT
jgi:hypothetical protein